MTQINKDSDFDFILKLKDWMGEDIGWPEWDFIAKLYTNNKAEPYVVSKLCGEYTNCFNDYNNVHIVMDNHKLAVGQIKVEFRALFYNPIYPDGSQRIVIPTVMPFELVNEGTREYSDLEASIEVPNYKNSFLPAITPTQTPDYDDLYALSKAVEAGYAKLDLEGIEWTDATLDIVWLLLSIKGTHTGVIKLKDTEDVDINDKLRLLDSGVLGEDAPLRVEYYPIPLGDRPLKISGDKEMPEVGEYKFSLSPTLFNDNLSVVWEISENRCATIAQDGTVTVENQGSEEGGESATVTCRVLLESGVEKTASMNVRFYHREAQIGDYVFADGTYDDIADESRTVIGLIYQVFKNADGSTSKIVIRNCTNLSNAPWGLSPTSFPNLEIPEVSGSIFLINDPTLPWDGMTMLQTDVVTQWNIKEAGSFVHNGWVRTQNIISHRDLILTALGLPLPYCPEDRASERSLVLTLSGQLVSQNNNENKYMQYYYPLISFIAHYQPLVKEGERLSSAFNAGNWFGFPEPRWQAVQPFLEKYVKGRNGLTGILDYTTTYTERWSTYESSESEVSTQHGILKRDKSEFWPIYALCQF